MRNTIFVLAVLLTSASGVRVTAQAGPSELGAAGWQAIQKNDADAASALFGRALALQPGDAVLHLGAGASAHMLGQDEAAARALQHALQLDPALTLASRMLGEIAYQRGDLDLAIVTYERALDYAPDSVELASRLDRMTAEASRRAAAKRFAVTFAGDREDRLAAHATQVLDAAYWRTAKLVGAYPSDAITIELDTARPLGDADRLRPWPVSATGDFDGRVAINAGGAGDHLEAFDRILVHALAHAMVASMAPTGVPGWLHEGLAQMAEPADPSLAERRLRTRASLPWPQLTDAVPSQDHQDMSLLVVRALIDRIGAKSTALLDDLADGTPLDAALAQFGFSYADLQADVTHTLR